MPKYARDHYTKWLQGWKAGGGFTGGYTLSCAWKDAKAIKPATGCSWWALGYLMAVCQRKGRELEAREWQELRD